ncbi:DNA polymerase III subunit delta' [Dokdonella sp.]|uniref:DNA polymerase III subunit delta' n=1 Tax=Dokdonella sp. TaxID=2291710 RepID=UPI001B244459|nr:DNA polymerase III subunit delta' [Dokdonella sp.]MBO9662719.1 DNA polymerase III subunit delta' [Dokdonella sp.]
MSLQPWLGDSWRVLAGALAAQRLHHGLLIVAPAGYGKRALAEAFAAAALCTQRDAEGRACGRCRGCQLLAAGSHPDFVRVALELRDDGKTRTEITVDQIRALSQRLAMSSQFGGLQIALIDPADRLNAAAANALLKTLEEPTPATVIVLVADEAARLPATIRSRCQRIDVRPPSREEALAWLHAQRVDAGRAQAALEASLGNPGLALEWLADATLDLREGCAEDLAALARGRRTAYEIAERWTADRPELRLWFAAALARDEANRLARGETGAFGLTARGEIPKLAAWFGRANRARGLLATPLRPELVLLDLLRTWPMRANPGRG